MLHLTKLLMLMLALSVGSVAVAADNSPFHNPNNPYDVDDSGVITQRDFLLIVNELQAGTVQPQAAEFDATDTFYWDTNNNGFVTPFDGLLVVNQLLATPTPEPSSLLMSGAGLAALAGYCIRRRWKRA